MKTAGTGGDTFRGRILRTAGYLALLALMFFGLRVWMQSGLVEGIAPPVSGVLLDGRRLEDTDFRGRPTLLHFWATWCPVCTLENRYLGGIAEDHRVVTVAIHSGSAGDVAGYMGEHGFDFPVLVDPFGDLADAFGVSAVPASFVLDGDGKIRFAESGLTSPWGLRARLWLAKR